MPDINQYTFSHKELVEMIIKSANIHEGRWWLLANFAVSFGNFGPTEDAVGPGVIFSLQNVGIQREVAGMQALTGLVVDAAIVNPSPTAHKKAESGSRKKKADIIS